MASSSDGLLSHLFSGVIVAFGGSNRERRNEAIKNLIGGILSVPLFFCGLALLQVRFPWGQGNGVTFFTNLFSTGLNFVFGLILVIFFGAALLFITLVLICLFFGTLHQMKKEKNPSYTPDPNSKSPILKKEDIAAKGPFILTVVTQAVLLILALALLF